MVEEEKVPYQNMRQKQLLTDIGFYHKKVLFEVVAVRLIAILTKTDLIHSVITPFGSI